VDKKREKGKVTRCEEEQKLISTFLRNPRISRGIFFIELDSFSCVDLKAE
jgi:hypothetical protein